MTIEGVGFAALSTDASVRSKMLRCRFGGDQSPSVLALSHTDTQVVCVTPWGEGLAQPVRVALNGGASFVTRTATATSSAIATLLEMPKFDFKGPKPPALVEAYFTPDSTTLVIRFDSQVRGPPFDRFLPLPTPCLVQPSDFHVHVSLRPMCV